MKKFIILAGVVTALLFSVLIYIVMGEDRTAPVIMQDNKNLIYKEGEDSGLLLSGVKAEDDVDGDVTATVIVGDVVTMPDKTAAKVTYLAKDSSNNVGELDIIIPCETELQKTEEKAGGAESSTGAKKEQVGQKGEQQSEQQVEQKGEQQGGQQGEQQAEKQSNVPVITLTAAKAEIKAGGEFHPEEYIKAIKDDKDSIQTLLQNLKVTGDYDRNKRGTYVLLLATKDSDGHSSEEVSLILNVK